MSAPISFLSDFGLEDEFVGVVHGVLYRFAPGSRVIDVTHAVPRGDVTAGALALSRAVQYLPPGVILAVVDPGVGTRRRALAVQTEFGCFVGPDNGLLSPAIALVGGASRVCSIENPEVIIPSPGSTFHGRDVFAPAAGLLASGDADLDDLGPVVDPASLVPMLLPLPSVEVDRVSGQVWWVDSFGNAETNIGPEELSQLGARRGGRIRLTVRGAVHELPWVEAYAEVAPGHPLLYVDSAGLVALGVRGERADEELRLTVGTQVTLSLAE